MVNWSSMPRTENDICKHDVKKKIITVKGSPTFYQISPQEAVLKS